MRLVGKSWAYSFNTRQVPECTMVDLSLRYGLDALGLAGTELRLNADNLLDGSDVASCLDFANGYFGERRSVTATLSHQF